MKKFFLILCFFLSASCALTRPETKKPDPLKAPIPKPEKIKLGLFISGAGANTFSALPLLELFQTQNISFDFIAGTGFGAWLAGLYAKKQTVEDIKWNLFKLKEQGVFEKNWFSKKSKKAGLLKSITKEALFSPLSLPFICPVLNSAGKVFWLKGKKPGDTILRCLNNSPPLFFSFGSKKEYASLFSADLVLKYLQKKGINTLIWIKPKILFKSSTDKALNLFLSELSSHLNNIKKQYIEAKTNNNAHQNNIIILETKTSSFLVSDFSKLNTIMKSPITLKERKKVIKLKNRLQTQKFKF